MWFEVDKGMRAGLPTELAARLKALEPEIRKLRQANGFLRKAIAHFAQAELDRLFTRWPPSSMSIVRYPRSSRSAGFWRSPRLSTTNASPGRAFPGGYATHERVDWFNKSRLFEPIGNFLPAAVEDRY